MTGTARSNAGSLADLQRAFQDYLLADSDAFRDAVRDGKKADRVTLLDVYRDGYALRLIEALTADYPGLMAMAGPADFDRMARAYIAAHPSRHPSVRWYGRGVADFLAGTPPYSRSPAAAEMARFEWALGETFDSPDVAPITADALMALPPEAWETLSFTTLPSLRRLLLAFEAPQAWQRREEVETGMLEVERASEPLVWAIWRPELLSNYRSLDGDEAAMLEALVEGKTFPELCEAVAAFTGDDQAPARTASLLRAMVEGGMIAGFSY
ncbi:DNA-binding domain-containing protein [soil metagenome]